MTGKQLFMLFFCFIALLSAVNPVNPEQYTLDMKGSYLDVGGSKIYYEVDGEGLPIILIHDGIVHSAIWDNQFKALAKKFKVVRYDRRGYGLSSKPKKKYSNIEDLYKIFTALNIDKAILAGISSGGRLVMDFTIAHPEKVSKIILVGAVVGGFPSSDHFATRGGRLTASDYDDPKKLNEYYIREDPYVLAPQNKDKKENLWSLMQNFSRNVDSAKNLLQIMPEQKTIDYLNEIKIPSLIVIGEFDIPDVFIHAGVIESGIPNAQRVIIRNAGHLVPYEQAEEFDKQVMRFFDSTEFFQVLDNEGLSAAVNLFKKKWNQDKTWVPFREIRIYNLGHQYLQEGKAEDAIELFKLYIIVYPESPYGYDGLGEAYMVNGDKELAIKNYKKSLDIYPNNKNAIEKLEHLK